jgi:hypothetical protein
MSHWGTVRAAATGVVVVLAMAVVTAATAVAQTDVLVSNGSPPGPFSMNKQNEPAVAIDQNHPNILAAGSNDEIDLEACNAGPDNDCPFTPGVGVSGIYFSTDNGQSWHQPTYTGWSARNCQGVPGDGDPECVPEKNGPIGTLPRYDEARLVADGDPALAFGPVPGANGRFSWANGSRLYYANLASHLPEGPSTFKGAEAIAVSRTDDVARANANDESAWMRPVIASRQSSAQFSDKEQIWADNASSSRFFGNVYICYADFRGNGNGFTNQPLMVVTSRDGGDSWTQHQVTSATNNISSKNGFGRSGCTVRTDSNGVVYVFTYQFGFDPDSAAPGQIQMVKSFDGGKHWGRPVNIFTAFDTCNYFEPSIGRCVEDGVAGARSDLSPAPSVDIANGAPTGAGANNRIVISWVDGRDGLNNEHVMYSHSTNGGGSWLPPMAIERPNPFGTPPRDRGYYSAPSISPDGSDVWVVYNAFDTPFRESAEGPGNDRKLVGVVLHSNWPPATAASFSESHRGVTGDARGSSQNDLAAEFLGDYVYSAATNDYSMSVWNDVRNAADCPAVDEYRQELHEEAEATGAPTAEPEEPRGAEDHGHEAGREQEEEGEAPAVQTECPFTFGNSDIFGAHVNDPTP